jgi:hypothetical protein
MEYFLETAKLDRAMADLLVKYDKDGNISFSNDEVVTIILDLCGAINQVQQRYRCIQQVVQVPLDGSFHLLHPPSHFHVWSQLHRGSFDRQHGGSEQLSTRGAFEPRYWLIVVMCLGHNVGLLGDVGEFVNVCCKFVFYVLLFHHGGFLDEWTFPGFPENVHSNIHFLNKNLYIESTFPGGLRMFIVLVFFCFDELFQGGVQFLIEELCI